jgi:hypothetical protein
VWVMLRKMIADTGSRDGGEVKSDSKIKMIKHSRIVFSSGVFM